jgi:hypothetical protein
MIFRDARRDEVPRIVALLADDELGAGRETGVDDAYLSAFDGIAADPRSRLIVADVDGQVAGKRRADAIRFYESLGFEASHEGLKLPL